MFFSSLYRNNIKEKMTEVKTTQIVGFLTDEPNSFSLSPEHSNLVSKTT